MKFLFLIYHEEKVLDTMPPKEMQKLVDSAGRVERFRKRYEKKASSAAS